jgi:hypothetical protein
MKLEDAYHDMAWFPLIVDVFTTNANVSNLPCDIHKSNLVVIVITLARVGRT